MSGNFRENFNGTSSLAKRQHYKKFVGVTATGWLERKIGKYLQGEKRGGIVDVYTRNGEKAVLERIPNPRPQAFFCGRESATIVGIDSEMERQ
ncbi:hypothetical protein HQ865_11235 [Mucilaginibacter mali]|uniref:Uncharacterized protein n=1 Tax=Mucilaginibacter mali TaxID=2740462 RepID=A0A7D4QSY3_9SPHI|nr:hypothetical protein [Mucilaginibacter mali]QKJ30309.1 hypothetical protein HQ865_11235 [Mucilaginibacter mali]